MCVAFRSHIFTYFSLFLIFLVHHSPADSLGDHLISQKRIFEAESNHSLLRPEVTTFLKSQRGYLHLDGARVFCEQRPNLFKVTAMVTYMSKVGV
jgi:hypothetical protein